MSTRTLLIRKVFRADDDDAMTVLRLVAAANDLGILWRMLMLYVKQEGQGAFRRTLSASAYRYACRMGTLHLPDVWKLINSGDFRRVEQRLARRIPDISRLAQQFKMTVTESRFVRWSQMSGTHSQAT